MSTLATHVHPRGSLAHDDCDVSLAPNAKDWHHTGLEVVTLGADRTHSSIQNGRETIVVPLHGAVDVSVNGDVYRMSGRSTPWQVTDVLYLPVGSEAVISSERGSRVALVWAVASREFPVQYVAREAVPSELRGAGICSRQVNNFGTPDAIRTDRLIACEVMQPGGNWSSYPPHKHDVDGPGETQLEEIYYYEIAPSATGTAGFALQRVYGSVAGDIDVTTEIRTGDVVTIPFGYHGPTIAAPGHDLYYLNVMAGPATELHPERVWLISDDPEHAWIRESWKSEPIDPRLPFGADAGREGELHD